MSCTFDTQRYFTVNSPTVNENIIKSLQTVFYYVAFVFYLFEKSFWHIYSFICGCAGSLLLHVGFSLLVASRGCSSLHGLLTVVASLAVQHGLQAQGLQYLWHMGLVVPGTVGIYLPRPGIGPVFPCIGKQILYHRDTRKASVFCF